MLIHHLKTSWRNVRREKSFVILTMAGLSAGIAAFLFIGLYVGDEWVYDRYHDDSDRLFRVVNHYLGDGGGDFARTPPILAPTLKVEIPEIAYATRFQRWGSVIQSGTKVFREREIFFTDTDTWNMFAWPFKRGSPARFSEPNTVVLTEALAQKYFDSDDVVGRTLLFNDTITLSVIGVIKNIPFQSHFHPDMLISWPTIERLIQRKWLNTWNSNTYYTYVKISDGATAASAETKLGTMVKKHEGADAQRTFSLQPLTDIHLRSQLQQEAEPNGSWDVVRVFALAALFVLGLACVNFVNLATGRSAERVKSVAVRKVMGAPRREIIFQFLFESVIVSLASVAVAILVMEAALPWFNELTGKMIEPGWWWSPVLLCGLAVFGTSVGLMAGAYPAILMSGFQPLKIFKRDLAWAGGAKLRHVLLVFQFFTTIMLVSGTRIVSRQLDFVRHTNLGFDQSQIVTIPFMWNKTVVSKLDAIKTVFREVPGVDWIAASGDIPGRMSTHMGYRVESMPEEESAGIQMLVADPDFISTYGLTLIAGKNFESTFTDQNEHDVILNEAAVKKIGWTAENALGRMFEMNGRGRIIGVVRNFHYNSLHEAIQPLVMTNWPSWFGYVSVRMRTARAAEALAGLEAAWGGLLPAQPFDYVFLDEDFGRQYLAQQRFGNIFLAFSILSGLIAGLGLLGLVGYSIQRRIKEISLRRVLGAGSASITRLLTKDYIILASIAAVIAIPLVYWMMQNWLEQFAYRISPDVVSLMLPGGLIAGLIVIIVAVQIVRNMTVNPAETLRNE